MPKLADEAETKSEPSILAVQRYKRNQRIFAGFPTMLVARARPVAGIRAN